MSDTALLATALAVLAYAAVSRVLRHAPVSPAMVFVAVGAVIGSSGLRWLDGAVSADGLEIVTTVTLVLVLYSDAAQLRIRLLEREAAIPVRLLGIGLPLTIAAAASSRRWPSRSPGARPPGSSAGWRPPSSFG